MIQVVDLFSCVGAHRLGWELASRIVPEGLARHVVHCERVPFRKRVLARRWPETPVHSDVSELTAEWVRGLPSFDPGLPTVVVGGPPCQATSPISSISGSKTNRSLVGEQVRIASGLEARWCIVEQPADTTIWEERAADAITSAGYYLGRVEFSASDLGAPYQRRRVYLLACSERGRLEVAVAAAPGALQRVRAATPAQSAGLGWSTSHLGVLRVAAEHAPRLDESGRRASVRLTGDRDRIERIEALGDSNPPEMMAVVAACVMEAER